MLNEIHRAIHDRAIVEFSYRGQGLRKVEPRMLHIISDGSNLLYVYQLTGFTRSGYTKGWRGFNVNHISQFRRTGEYFHKNRPDPSTEEALDLIEMCLEQQVPETEAIAALERAGVSPTWCKEQISKWKADKNISP